MQLEGATELELRLYHLCRECEIAMPAGEFETRLVVALSDAASELQRLRAQMAELEAYATHKPGCVPIGLSAAGCTCGLTALLKVPT